MKRSLQEVVELVVFGLIALLIGTGVLWLGGWVLGWVGLLLKFLAGLIWWLLRFIVPVAIVAGLIYFLVRVLQGDRSGRSGAPAAPNASGTTAPATTAPATTPTGGAPAPAPAAPAAADEAAPDEAAPAQSASAEEPSGGDEAASPASDAEHESDSEDDDKRN